MDLSTTHDNARTATCRIPALQASLALLVEDTQRAEIAIYGGARPDPGAAPGSGPLVAIPLASAPGTIEAPTFRIVLTVPIEAQVSTDGTATWARITDGSGAWWADVSVSDNAGAGEIKLQPAALYSGAFCRLTSAVFQG
jgi:hypothetical protein